MDRFLPIYFQSFDPGLAAKLLELIEAFKSAFQIIIVVDEDRVIDRWNSSLNQNRTIDNSSSNHNNVDDEESDDNVI